jgi:protein gp37
VWGKTAGRRELSDSYWREPLKWNRRADRAGVRYRVFCASMADVFEDRPDVDWLRTRLWGLIEQTPHLDWMLLTKRPENILDMLPLRWSGTNPLPPNMWMGCTAEDQECADERLPHLMQVDAVVRFVSYEPAAGPLTFHPDHLMNLHLVIAGGETGHGAQPAHPDWFRAVRDQCVASGTAFHFKQHGDWLALDKWRDPQATHAIRSDSGHVVEIAPMGERTYAASYWAPIVKVGKKVAGRLLDGRTWDEMPEQRGSAA